MDLELLLILIFVSLFIFALYLLPTLMKTYRCNNCKLWLTLDLIKSEHVISGVEMNTNLLKKCRKCGYEQKILKIENIADGSGGGG